MIKLARLNVSCWGSDVISIYYLSLSELVQVIEISASTTFWRMKVPRLFSWWGGGIAPKDRTRPSNFCVIKMAQFKDNLALKCLFSARHHFKNESSSKPVPPLKKIVASPVWRIFGADLGVCLRKSFRIGVVVGLWSVAKWDATRTEDTKDQRSKPARPLQNSFNIFTNNSP